jgi:8-oxo-dGTP pyrophosphatase MutT (NUDIX family)
MMTHRTLSVAVAVAILHDKKILIGKRGPECLTGKGLLALPGGHVDDGETIADAIVRECVEETGLTVKPHGRMFRPPLFATVTPWAVSDYGPAHNHLTLWFAATLAPYCSEKPLVMEPTKCEWWQWMSLVDIAHLPGVHDPSSEQYYWLPHDIFANRLYPIWLQLH